MKHYLDAAETAARAAGGLLRKHFHRSQHVNVAEAHDIKLAIDVETQELITKALLKQFPEHALYGEEGVVGDQSSDHQWVVDPLDGTVNYFYQIPHFCVSIALRFKGEIIVGVIYDPMRDEMWSVQKGEKPRLNGEHFRVSARTNLAEAVVSVELAKTDRSIDSNLPLLEAMIHRVRKCRVLGAPRSTWLTSRAAGLTPTSNAESVCGTSRPDGFWLKLPVGWSICAHAKI